MQPSMPTIVINIGNNNSSLGSVGKNLPYATSSSGNIVINIGKASTRNIDSVVSESKVQHNQGRPLDTNAIEPHIHNASAFQSNFVNTNVPRDNVVNTNVPKESSRFAFSNISFAALAPPPSAPPPSFSFACSNSPQTATTLLKKNAYMSLSEAVKHNKREEVERLLRSGSDVNEKDEVRYIIKHAT